MGYQHIVNEFTCGLLIGMVASQKTLRNNMFTYTIPAKLPALSPKLMVLFNITNENLEQIIDRIKQIIRQIKLTIPSHNINLSKIICPITYDTPKDPVVTNCGHIL